MDFYEQMTMADLPEKEQLRLAEALRGRSATGAQLSTSTIEPVSAQGTLMQKMAQDTAQQVGLQNYRKRSLEEQGKDREALLVKALASAKGKKGDDWTVKWSNSALEKFQEDANTAHTITGLTARWDDKYARTIPGSGPLEEWLGGNLGVTEDMQAMASWWSDYKRDYENILRHGLFGSALTDSEKAEWKKANISSNMPPELVRSKLETLNRITMSKALRGLRSALDRNMSPAYAYDTFQGYVPDEAWESREALDSYINAATKKYASPAPVERGGSLDQVPLKDLLRMYQEQGGEL